MTHTTSPAPPALDVAVIGGGAAGFFAAITCAESNPRCLVTLYEKSSSFLSKLRVSGGGRCNVTNACFDPRALVQNYPRGAQALLGPFHRFGPRDTQEWFKTRGITLKTEADGRVFPANNLSKTIFDCLTKAAQEAGVIVCKNVSIVSIDRREPSGFLLTLKTGLRLPCQRLLLATGGDSSGHAWAKTLGHCVEKPIPSLFSFNIKDRRLRGLSGISMPETSLKLEGTPLAQAGPVLITHWGLSGPAALKLSAWGARALHQRGYKAKLCINWLNMPRERIEHELMLFKVNNPRKTLLSHNPFGVPVRLWERFVEKDQRWADMTKAGMTALVNELSSGLYEIRGRGAFKDEFVTCGGVRLAEVDFKSMQSRLCPGLFFAGEILDIDGVTGGFNFQNAWTTGRIAGLSMG